MTCQWVQSYTIRTLMAEKLKKTVKKFWEIHLVSMVKKFVSISFIVAAEDDGSSRHCGGGFTGEVRSRVAWIDSVSSSWSGHILRPLPTVMVCVSITNLFILPHKSQSDKFTIKLEAMRESIMVFHWKWQGRGNLAYLYLIMKNF